MIMILGSRSSPWFPGSWFLSHSSALPSSLAFFWNYKRNFCHFPLSTTLTLLVNRTSQIYFPHKLLPCHLSWVSGGIHLSTDRWIEPGVSPQHILSYHREGDNECHFHRWARRTTGPHKHLHPWGSDKVWSLSVDLIFLCRSSHHPSARTSAFLPQLGGSADLGGNIISALLSFS